VYVCLSGVWILCIYYCCQKKIIIKFCWLCHFNMVVGFSKLALFFLSLAFRLINETRMSQEGETQRDSTQAHNDTCACGMHHVAVRHIRYQIIITLSIRIWPRFMYKTHWVSWLSEAGSA
jgi:hypothetical protein